MMPAQWKLVTLDALTVLPFLADRTNGCAYATVLRMSSSVTLCIVAKQCVLEQGTIDSLQEVVYEKSIGTKMNDLNLYLEVV